MKIIKMKIIHITATHLKKYGGIPIVLEKLVLHQNNIQNVQAVVLSVKSDVKEIKSNYFYFESGLNRIISFIKEYDADVIIFHGLYYKEYVRISRIISKLCFKYYIQPHSSFGESAQKKNGIKKYIANRIIFKNFIKKAYGYIFLNEAEKSKSIFKTSKDVIIPNGIDFNARAIIKQVDEKIKIYFIGRLDVNHKGIDLLFEDLKKIDNVRRNFSLDIYGNGSKHQIDIVQAYIKQFKNLEIHYKGSVYDQEKEKMLKESHIMILTSRYEGFPMTVLEALSYGNPCIVTEGTNVKAMIEENQLGWGTDDNSISETILKCIEDYKLKKEFYIEHTKHFVKEKYCWENIAKLSVETLLDN
jgi:glycosyltransferase involved in cell wall biosynthesis